jgi:hypothetical protein
MMTTSKVVMRSILECEIQKIGVAGTPLSDTAAVSPTCGVKCNP